MVDLADSVFRDFVTDGVPSSGTNKPQKQKIREWGAYLESLATLAFTSGKVYATKAALDADLVPSANTPALVIGDATTGNDGLYMKVGATTTGSWTQLLDFVPGAQIVHAVDAGAGTPNAIVATTGIALSTSGSQLVRLDMFEANTASPVTVTFNDGNELTIKTASGNDVVAGGLAVGPVLGVVDSSTFRLLSDQASAAIVAAAEAAVVEAEAAAAEAEAAAEIAEGFASDIVSQGNVPVYATQTGMPALSVPIGITGVRVNGYSAAGDGGNALFKKVGSEPSHAGKFQSLDGAWWEVVVPAAGLDVRIMGVKADGVTDDYAAMVRADTITNHLRLPIGRVMLSQMFTPVSHPIKWIGSGKDVIKTSATVPTKSTQIVGNHTGLGVIEISSATNAATENFVIEGIEITGKFSAPPDDQHGIIIRDRWHCSLLNQVTFSSLTGCGIAIDPGTSGNPAYAQQVRWTDISMYNCGGALGLTQEPVVSQDSLVCTGIVIDNFNWDHAVNTQSPRSMLFDFRTFREIVINGIVTEGAGAVGMTTIYGFATNGPNIFNVVHAEFTTNAPTYFAYFHANPDNRFYSVGESKVQINGLSASGKMGFGAAVESSVIVRDWTRYGDSASTYADFAEFTDHGGFLRIEELGAKVMPRVPYNLAGQFVIGSMRGMDAVAPSIKQGPAKLASWRPSKGVISAFNSRHVSGSLLDVASSAIEVDDVDARLNVFRATSTVGKGANVRWGINLPSDWVVSSLGPVLTAVIRYRIVKDAGDAATTQTIAVAGADIVATTSGGSRTNVTDGTWNTAIVTFRPNKTAFNIVMPSGGTAPLVAMITRIAAFDLYLGTDWQEPLDLEYP